MIDLTQERLEEALEPVRALVEDWRQERRELLDRIDALRKAYGVLARDSVLTLEEEEALYAHLEACRRSAPSNEHVDSVRAKLFDRFKARSKAREAL